MEQRFKHSIVGVHDNTSLQTTIKTMENLGWEVAGLTYGNHLSLADPATNSTRPRTIVVFKRPKVK